MARWVGMQVNSDTTSKDTRISSGSTDIVRIFSTKDALFFILYLLFWSGDKMLARYLDNSYVGDPMALVIGLSGMFSLWILGRP